MTHRCHLLEPARRKSGRRPERCIRLYRHR